MFHGHLYVANGALGSEAFVHDGREFTYFVLFPSLIRMPVPWRVSQIMGSKSGGRSPRARWE
jgi:hypothetical protein